VAMHLIQDKRKLVLVNDVDPSLHYEIDRSELVPIDSIPAFRKVNSSNSSILAAGVIFMSLGLVLTFVSHLQSATQEVRLVDWRGTKVVARTLYLSNTADPDTM